MATGTAGSTAREYHQNVVHFLRKTITYADNGTTVTIGTLPSGALILPELSGVYVSTAFNGNATNTLDVGITGTLEKYSSDLALGTAGFIEQDVITTSSATVALLTSDETIVGVVTSTAAASAGSAEVIIAYIPDTDG
jgi:predicted RecA/RadA family phage recombinase